MGTWRSPCPPPPEGFPSPPRRVSVPPRRVSVPPEGFPQTQPHTHTHTRPHLHKHSGSTLRSAPCAQAISHYRSGSYFKRRKRVPGALADASRRTYKSPGPSRGFAQAPTSAQSRQRDGSLKKNARRSKGSKSLELSIQTNENILTRLQSSYHQQLNVRASKRAHLLAFCV